MEGPVVSGPIRTFNFGTCTDKEGLTACLRCRLQKVWAIPTRAALFRRSKLLLRGHGFFPAKLKCDRGRPTCSRCRRLGADCSYPAPPDRRGPRGKRKRRPLRARTDDTGEGTGAGQHPALVSEPPETGGLGEPASDERPAPLSSDISRPPVQRQYPVEHAAATDNVVGYASTSMVTEYPVLSGSYQNQLRKSTSLPNESALEAGQPPPLPPTSLGLALLEIYFARIYNASILFHKPLLFQQYIEGTIHRALLRAVFAMATLFLHPRSDENRSATTSNEELAILSVYQSSGLPWAKAALTEAMQLVMQSPSLMVVQALQCVQLYWFGVGQPHSGDLCIALAYRASQVLGFDKRLPREHDISSETLEVELGRRCFWACWISTCIVMEPEPYVESAWKEAAMLPLPGSIASSSQGWRVTYNQSMDKYWHAISVQPRPPEAETRPATASGSLIKMIGVWAKVQLLCKDRPSSITTGELTSVHHFSHLATVMFHDATSARSSAYQDDSTMEVQNIYMFHDAIYHQCQIVLHSLVVPLFSGIPADRNLDNHRQAQVMAAETVLKHADLYKQLLMPYLHGDEDVSRLPPLLGYGAFVVGMVFLSTDAARRNQVATEATADADEANDRLLAVKDIWEVLSSALQPYLSRSSDPTSLRDRPASLRSKDRGVPQTTEGIGRSANGNDEGRGPGEYTEGSGDSATRPASNEQALDGNLEEVLPNVSFAGQADLFADCGWYGMSLAEVGVEQLVGYEPSSLFLQGWKAFS
ncbi:Fungal transcriptional regulatory [Cordyceps militaris]|uniref:Fungal transcriptional regulatory n=1 Tax=Cordyceps militaris TaxID=73501 RepID=A0A2H4SLE9_CORMI|nr:Fungal transcriptional regulatory [Cordyceps militaris]